MRALLTICSRRIPQLLDPDDHRSDSGHTSLSGASLTANCVPRQDGGVTTPFDDPQAELAWMFLQCLLSEGGDVDECFSLLSDDFTYWNLLTRSSVDKATLRDEVDRRQRTGELNLDFIQCFNDGESVVIEAEADGETPDGLRYHSPAVFIFETREGLIASLREYSDTQLTAHVFGPANR
jgi:ketosteroid isomerase-like protein